MLKGIDIRGRELQSVDMFSVPEAYADDLEGILISSEEVNDRVERIAQEVERDYNGLDIYAICVMNGALHFFNELMYENGFNKKFQMNFIKTSRYGKRGDESQERTQVYGWNLTDIEGKDVLIVEDIIDEGITIIDIVKHLQQYNPKSIRIAALLDKLARRKSIVINDHNITEYTDETKTKIKESVNISGLYTGFIIDNHFVVGYGLDFNEDYRGLPHVSVLKQEVYRHLLH
jgi:hypoxanthine phosphoribosyltransferase